MKKYIIGLCTAALSYSSVSAQGMVENITVQPQDSLVYVFYQLARKANVDLYISLNNGITYKGPLAEVKGDVGVDVEPGDKMICWHALKEMGEFDSNSVRFKISADETKDKKEEVNDENAVDLGLPSGTLWSRMDLGAKKPESRGDYFAWGETSPIGSYTGNGECVTCGMRYDALLENGIIDSAGVLTPKYDAATVLLGENWRMPTKEDFDELKLKCTWTWVKHNGVCGYRVKGPNGKYIFLHAGGCRKKDDLDKICENGHYWSSTVYRGANTANSMFFDASEFGRRNDRDFGQLIRPVYNKK
ncbi:MAG: hypothetical protein MJZ00_02055 [Paludibacteraceae bacterium]|nr:hypothetical protein [Paludibacteraceae bacterium]